MRKTLTVLIVAAFAAVGLLAGQLMAAFVPPALPAGSQYQLLFVTADTTDATSSDINDYNLMASYSASLNSMLPAATWQAIVSTPSVNAMTNAPWAGVPVYNTQGVLLSDANGIYFFAGFSVAPVEFDQYGNTAPENWIWTGTNNDGNGLAGHELGTAIPVTGQSLINYQWLGNAVVDSAETLHPIYAMSGPITAVPEPGGFVLSGSALFLYGAACRLKARKRGS